MEILNTAKLSVEVEELIDQSKVFTIIVSPYLKINNRLKPKLTECFSRNKRNLILYRENKLSTEEFSWLNKKKNVTLFPIKNLHAKCYMNENTAIITSMNLYDYSQINNHELGIKLSIEEEQNLLKELLKQIKAIVSTDHEGYDFSDYLGPDIVYTMSMLYSELSKNFDFPKRFRTLDGTYLYMCKIAKMNHNFHINDLTDNETKILRSTVLDEKTYKKLKFEISKMGVKK